jgi:hypothetical protein
MISDVSDVLQTCLKEKATCIDPSFMSVMIYKETAATNCDGRMEFTLQKER